jgi:aminoglycoside phosphotransferase (APT) family kinase protein
LVRNPRGDIYVHRRTMTKDVYPGRYDVMAGGVIAYGEDPHAAAVRELAEELGITGVELTALPEGDYRDGDTAYHAYLYSCVWDGPVRQQPEEVDWGDWLTPSEVLARMDDPDWPFVPDSASLLVPLLRTLAALSDDGWDNRAWTDGAWLYREPRRDAIAHRVLAETRLLPWLAPRLPSPVPVPEPYRTGVRHRLLTGEPLDAANATAAIGAELGRFLTALHALDPDEAARRGAQDAPATAAEIVAQLDRMRVRVLPSLPEPLRAAGAELLDRIGQPVPRLAMTHADLGPEHILVVDDHVTGIIDWSDARVGDPALDLAWSLHGAPAGMAEGVATAYVVTPDLRDRARDWYLLAPWHQALRGFDIDLADDVAAGVAEAAARLSQAGPSGRWRAPR